MNIDQDTQYLMVQVKCHDKKRITLSDYEKVIVHTVTDCGLDILQMNKSIFLIKYIKLLTNKKKNPSKQLWTPLANINNQLYWFTSSYSNQRFLWSFLYKCPVNHQQQGLHVLHTRTCPFTPIHIQMHTHPH